MDLGLAGSVAVVAGGSRGIGRAVAEAFVGEGANVVICARDEVVLDEVAQMLHSRSGVDVRAVPGDLSQPGAPARLVQAALDYFGFVDTLVNVAGSAAPGRIGELTDEDWDAAISLKFMGAVRSIRAVLPHMRERGKGCIVNVGGVAGWQPMPNQLAIGSVNAALFNLTRGLAREAAGEGVRVNTVVPGPTDTDRFRMLVRRSAEAAGVSEDEARARVLAEVPDGRPGLPAEVGAAVAFLASRHAQHINGAILEVDGGQTRGMH